MQPLCDWILMCGEKWILYDNWQGPAQLLDPEKLQSTPQSHTCTQKSPSHCLVVCCPSGPLQLSESWGNHYIWEVCWANWWDASKTVTTIASIGQQKGPNSSPQQPPMAHHTTNQCFKSWTNWATQFWLIGHIHLTSHQSSSTSSRILTAFCSENASTTSRREKMLSKTS